VPIRILGARILGARAAPAAGEKRTASRGGPLVF
jgi:hypothetical protein